MPKPSVPEVFEYPTPDGVVLHYKRMPSALLVQYTMRFEKTKPKPPMYTAKVGRQEVAEYDYTDPAYLERLDEWRRDTNFSLVNYVVVSCTVDAPPPDFDLGFDFDSPAEQKLFWINTLFGDLEAVATYANTIMGVDEPTEEDIADAEATFRRDVP